MILMLEFQTQKQLRRRISEGYQSIWSPSNHIEMGAQLMCSVALLRNTNPWPWTGAAVPRQHSTHPLLHSLDVEKRVRSTCITHPVHGNHTQAVRKESKRTGPSSGKVWVINCCLSQGHLIASDTDSGLMRSERKYQMKSWRIQL